MRVLQLNTVVRTQGTQYQIQHLLLFQVDKWVRLHHHVDIGCPNDEKVKPQFDIATCFRSKNVFKIILNAFGLEKSQHSKTQFMIPCTCTCVVSYEAFVVDILLVVKIKFNKENKTQNLYKSFISFGTFCPQKVHVQHLVIKQRVTIQSIYLNTITVKLNQGQALHFTEGQIVNLTKLRSILRRPFFFRTFLVLLAVYTNRQLHAATLPSLIYFVVSTYFKLMKIVNQTCISTYVSSQRSDTY